MCFISTIMPTENNILTQLNIELEKTVVSLACKHISEFLRVLIMSHIPSFDEEFISLTSCGRFALQKGIISNNQYGEIKIIDEIQKSLMDSKCENFKSQSVIDLCRNLTFGNISFSLTKNIEKNCFSIFTSSVGSLISDLYKCEPSMEKEVLELFILEK